jgi:hypothetical protein
MDEFPANFNLQHVQQQHLDQSTAYGQSQQLLLKEERKLAYEKICMEAQGGKTFCTIELPIMLCSDMKRTLARELCARFPGHVHYRRVVEYADVDEFILIKNEANPPASFEYRVYFR